jgi:LysR family nitrogen assimilation transcriptional regulator
MNEFERLFDVSGLSLDRLRTFLRVVEAGNLTKAAQGDVTKQSQFSRQIKELEGFFGVALTRRVGRRIEITDEGHRLALVIRRHFRELDDFREAMAGRSVSVRFGSQGSIIDWLLVPRLGVIREALGNAMIELEQLRTLDVVRAVADGRLDFGIVREDTVPAETKRWRLGSVGYALFAASALWRGCATAEDVIRKSPVADLLAGGQFSTRWQEWLSKEKLRPRVLARVSSFTDLARVVQAGQAAAVLPDMAAVDFDPKKFEHRPIASLKSRTLVLIANVRSLDRSGIVQGVAERVAERLVAG